MPWQLGFRALLLGSIPCSKQRKTLVLFKNRCRARPGFFGWLWIFLYVLFSSEWWSGFIVATDLASRAWLFHLEAGSCLITALLLGAVCGKGSLWTQVVPWKSACQWSEVRPEALMRQKGIWARIKIPGDSEFLDCLVWLNYLTLKCC